jgi:hypothetical protein
MSLMVEGVVYRGMDIEKGLGGSRRLEPLHLALSSPHNSMGVFSAIILSEASLVRAGEAQLPESRAVGAQLVGDQQLRCEALFLEYFAHQPECRLRIAPTLNEHVEDLAFVVDGAPLHMCTISTPYGGPAYAERRRPAQAVGGMGRPRRCSALVCSE